MSRFGVPSNNNEEEEDEAGRAVWCVVIWVQITVCLSIPRYSAEQTEFKFRRLYFVPLPSLEILTLSLLWHAQTSKEEDTRTY